MIYYDRIDVQEGIDINEKSASRECIICQYCYFLYMGFKFQSTMCNGCNNLLMMSLNINHIIIFNIIGIGYRCIIVGTSKSEDINLLRNTYMSENSGPL